MTKRRRCEFCDEPLPEGARSNQKYCDADCRRGRVRSSEVLEAVAGLADDVEMGEVEAGLEEALAEAAEKQRLTVLDRGTIAAARVLARKIDEEQARWDYCFEWGERWLDWQRQVEESGFYDDPPPPPPKAPPVDNVSIPTFLKYCESLGLTPAGRGRIPGEKAKGGGGGGSGLVGLAGGVPRPA